jgi:hypothetical protein
MTQVAARKRPTVTTLIFLWGGPLLMVAGLIGAFVNKSNGDQELGVDRFNDKNAGVAGFSNYAGADYTQAWVWLAIAVLGLGVLVAGIALRVRHAG